MKTSGTSTAEAGPHLGGKSAISGDLTPATQDLRSVSDESLTTSEISGGNPSSLPLTEDDIWERLNDWVVSLPREDTMMLSMLPFFLFSASVQIWSAGRSREGFGNSASSRMDHQAVAFNLLCPRRISRLESWLI